MKKIAVWKRLSTWLLFSKKRIIVVVGVVLVCLFGFWKIFINKSDKVSYQTATVEKKTLISSVSASGKAISTNILEINTKATGVVKKVYVKEGDTVYKGQKIAELTLDSAGELSYLQALNSYQSAKNSLESANSSLYSLQSSAFSANQKFINDAVARSLATDDPTYIQQYADWKAAEAKYNQQAAVIAQAKTNLSNASLSLSTLSPIITSSYSGKIENLSLTEGLNITGQKRVATVSLSGTPIVEVSLSEVDVNKVKIGQRAVVTFDSLTDKTFTGVVATLDRLGSTSSNVTTYVANIKLDSKSSEILPNMAGTAKITINSVVDSLVIPSSAIQTTNNMYYAKVLKEGREELVEVSLGIEGDDGVEVKSGLSEGQTVITGTTSVSKTTKSTTSTKSVFSSVGGGGGGMLPR